MTTSSSSVLPSATATGASESSEDTFFESLALFTLENLKKARETLTGIMEGLEGTERAKVSYIRDQVDKFIEQLKKSKSAGVLGKVFKALGIVGLILSALVACIIPTPMTVAIFAVALVMVMEPLIAEAGGYDSVIQKGMSEMMKGLSSVFGNVGGAIVGAILILVMMLLVTSAAASGLAMIGTSLAQSTSAAAQFLRQLPNFLQGMLTGELTMSQQAALLRFLEATESCITAAQGGLQVGMGMLKMEVAKLMHAFELDQASIDLINHLLESVGQDAAAYQSEINNQLQMMPQLFAPLQA